MLVKKIIVNTYYAPKLLYKLYTHKLYCNSYFLLKKNVRKRMQVKPHFWCHKKQWKSQKTTTINKPSCYITREDKHVFKTVKTYFSRNCRCENL